MMSGSADKQHRRKLQKPKKELRKTAGTKLRKLNGELQETTNRKCSAIIARRKDTGPEIARRKPLICRMPLDKERKKLEIEPRDRGKDRRRPCEEKRRRPSKDRRRPGKDGRMRGKNRRPLAP